MNKFILEHSPLVMALVDLRFTTIPKKKIEQGLEDFKSSLFDLGLSIFHESELNQVEAQPTSEGHLEFKTHKNQRFDFLSLQRNKSVILTTESLCFRTTDYKHFDEFKDLWTQIIESFFSSFPQAENAGMRRMGLRYTDAFLPQQDDKYTDYISEEWISYEHRASDISTLNSFRQQRKTAHGILRIELEERLPDDNTIELFPRDIQDPPPVSVTVNIKDIWQTASLGKYALLDVDHSWLPDDKQVNGLSIETINSALQHLHGDSSEIFWGILSAHAEKVWNKKEIGRI